jgi:hypothetical protein
MSQKKFKEVMTLRCLIGMVVAPVAVSLLLAPRFFDFLFPNVAAGFKAIILIGSILLLLWIMLDSGRTALYVTVWTLIVHVFAVAFEIDRLLPPESSSQALMNSSSASMQRRPPPAPKRLPTVITKENDTLGYSTFDAKEKTPIPTPTVTPNLTPFFDFSRFTEKDQSIGTLPKSAFFGKDSGGKGGSMTDGLMKAIRSFFHW